MRASLASVCLSALAGLVALVAACSPDSDNEHVLSVYAASSLTDVFGDLESAFEAAHPGADVRITFAGSQILRLQIEQGADADVFASANPAHLQALVEAGLVERGETFAHNELVVVVPLDNPAGVESFADLTRASRLVIGSENVPVGAYTRQLLRRAGAALGAGFERQVMANVVSEETNVRLVRAKIELGEADAAIVYRTDAAASERVRVVPIAARANVRAEYVIGVVRDSVNRPLAADWVAFVGSPEGRRILAARGFVVE